MPRIPCSGEKDQDRTGLDWRTLMQGLVVVAVEEDRSPRRRTALATTLLEVLVR
jgi:hypothetical protein